MDQHPDPVILDSFELWELRAFEQRNEAVGIMLHEIREGFRAGYVAEGNARVALASARKSLDPNQVNGGGE